MLEALALSKSFVTPAETIRAVDSVSLVVNSGEYVCLHGTSGSGKTTLLYLLCGLLRADSGVMRVNDVELTKATPSVIADIRRTQIGFVFQRDNLIDEFEAWENVALPLEIQGYEFQESQRLALEALDLVGVREVSHRRPRELSGGQRQRVGIARALVGGRRILLADEPTGALDSENSRALFQLLGTLADAGRTVVVVSHDPECRRWSHRTIEMVDGRIDSRADEAPA